MPDWFSQYEAKPAAHNGGADWFSQFKAEPVSGPHKFAAGAKAEIAGQAQGIDLLMDTSRDVVKKINPLSVLSDGVALARGGKPDENVALQTMRGFGQGAWQGVKDLTHHPVESLDPTGAVAVAKSKDDNWTKAGHGSVLAAESLLPFLRPLKRIRGLRAAAAEAEAAQAEMRSVAAGLTPGPTDAVVAHGLGGPKAPPQVSGARLVKDKVPSIQQSITDALAETRKPALAPSVELPPPPFSNGSPAPPAQPRVTVTAPKTPAPRRAPVEPLTKGLAAPPGREGHFTLPEKIATDAEFELARKEAGFGPSTGEMDRRAVGGTLQPVQTERRGIKTPEQVHGTSEAPVAVDPNLGPDAFTTGPGLQEPPVPQFDQPLTAAEVAQEVAKRTGTTPRTITGVSRVTPKPGVVADARHALGADRAAGHLEKLGVKMSPDEIRTAEGGPSRQPYAKLDAENDLSYRRRLSDERGGINPKLAMTMGGAAAGGAGFAAMADDDHKVGAGIAGALAGAGLVGGALNPRKLLNGVQQVRVGAQLSGAALPKSVLGDVGAAGTLAMERHSIKPIKELLRVPTNIREARNGWAAHANPQNITGGGHGAGTIGKYNVFPRAIGALDHATTVGLQRAGVPLADIQHTLLTSPNTFGTGGLNDMMKSDIGRLAYPYQNTPANAVVEGGNAVKELLTGKSIGKPGSRPPVTTTKRVLTGAVGAAGMAAGSQTDDPRTLALLAALMGPRGIPFALGAGITGGQRVMSKIGVGLPDGAWDDFTSPAAYTKSVFEPSLMRFLAYLRGEKPGQQ